jgi:hypothetical protein
MRKKEDVTANLEEYAEEYAFLKNYFGMDPEMDPADLVNGFWHGPEVVSAIRYFAYSEQHKDADNGKG